MRTDRYDQSFACPACGDRHDSTSSMQQDIAPPKPGDAMVCVMCMTVNVWTGDGVRLATGDEQLQFAMDERIQKLLWAMRILGPPPRAARSSDE